MVPFGLGELEGTGSWEAQEQRTADLMGGRRQRGSGASVYARGDVKSDQFLIENKQTAAASLRITWEWLKKITAQALANDRLPALFFELRCQSPRDLTVESEWVAIPLSVWRRLTEE